MADKNKKKTDSVADYSRANKTAGWQKNTFSDGPVKYSQATADKTASKKEYYGPLWGRDAAGKKVSKAEYNKAASNDAYQRSWIAKGAKASALARLKNKPKFDPSFMPTKKSMAEGFMESEIKQALLKTGLYEKGKKKQ